MNARRTGNLLLSAILLGGWALDAVAQSAQPRTWLRVRHTDLPITFELPEEATVQPHTAFSLAQARTDDLRKVEVTLFGIRSLSETRRIYDAIQIGFFWVTKRYKGVDAERLAAVSETIQHSDTSRALLRSVFYAKTGSIELTDAGAEFVDGRLARRIAIQKHIAAGTAHERTIDGAAVVVPVTADVALVVVARFDRAATEHERDELFPRVLGSIDIGDDAKPGPRVL